MRRGARIHNRPKSGQGPPRRKHELQGHGGADVRQRRSDWEAPLSALGTTPAGVSNGRSGHHSMKRPVPFTSTFTMCNTQSYRSSGLAAGRALAGMPTCLLPQRPLLETGKAIVRNSTEPCVAAMETARCAGTMQGRARFRSVVNEASAFGFCRCDRSEAGEHLLA